MASRCWWRQLWSSLGRVTRIFSLYCIWLHIFSVPEILLPLYVFAITTSGLCLPWLKVFQSSFTLCLSTMTAFCPKESHDFRHTCTWYKSGAGSLAYLVNIKHGNKVVQLVEFHKGYGLSHRTFRQFPEFCQSIYLCRPFHELLQALDPGNQVVTSVKPCLGDWVAI